MEISKGKVDASFWKGKKVFLQVIQDLKDLGCLYGFKTWEH